MRLQDAFWLIYTISCRANTGVTAGQQDPIPRHVREFWMREAIEALGSPCPFEAFGAVIVDHSAGSPGVLICSGANNIASGNPTLHGEIAAINNCTSLLTDPRGEWRLNGEEARASFHRFSLYTTAEPCPMCAAAIRWAGFKETLVGTSSAGLTRLGWPQMQISTAEVFDRSEHLDPKTLLFENLLSNETDTLFQWQFSERNQCPPECHRDHAKGLCVRVYDDNIREEL